MSRTTDVDDSNHFKSESCNYYNYNPIINPETEAEIVLDGSIISDDHNSTIDDSDDVKNFNRS